LFEFCIDKFHTSFAKAVVREREIPFKISSEPSDMTAGWTSEYWGTIKEKLAIELLNPILLNRICLGF